jgi:hypothetical protein
VEERAITIYVTGVAEPKSKVVFALAGIAKSTTATSTGLWTIPLAKSITAGLPVGNLTATAVTTDIAGNVSVVASRLVVKQ